jgi:hypothetical protein
MRKTNLAEAEAMVAWIQLPLDEREASPLAPKQLELMERWNVADNLFREHMSERKVVLLLQEKFGYSESSARRDLDCARRVWGTRPRADKDYLSNTMIDYLFECMVKAGGERKWRDVEKLAGRIESLAGIGKKDETPIDPDDLRRPVPVLVVYRPELVGGTPMSDSARIELRDRMLRKKVEMGYLDAQVLDENIPAPDGSAD